MTSTLRAKQTLRKQVNLAWTELTSSIAQMASGCDVQPTLGSAVFDIEQNNDQSIEVTVRPVAFRLREKVQDDKARMFVTVAGKVNFSIGKGMDPPLACFFKTEVGYFRMSGAKSVDHVLGLHYDFDDRTAGHPVFHGQLTSCHDHLATINANYRPELEIKKNLMTHVARKVRVPTAHMDPMAVFVQLLADHLMNENSGPLETAAFEKARAALMFFKSDPSHSSRMAAVTEEACFRGPRWYPAPSAPVPIVAAAVAAQAVVATGH